MLIAVPLFGRDIAPRFGFADTFLIADIEGRTVTRIQSVSIEIGSWANRFAQLHAFGIELLLCGGFNRAFLPLAESMGIRIVAGLYGDAKQTLEAYARPETIPAFHRAKNGHTKHPGQGCRRKQVCGRVRNKKRTSH